MMDLAANFKGFRTLLTVVLMLNALVGLGQNSWTGATDANWNTATNWLLSHVPTALENVTIPNGGSNPNITINTAAVCSSLTFTGGNATNSLTIAGANSLTVTNVITINNGTAGGANKTLAVGAGTLSCASISMTATGNNNRNSSLTISTGTATVSGSITMGDANDLVTFTNTGTLNIGNTMTGGTLTPSTGTVNYNNAGAQTVGAYNNYYNLTLSNSGAKTLQVATTTIGGNLTLSGTASTTTVNNTLGITGNLNIGDGTTINVANTNFSVTGTTTVGGGTSGQINFTSTIGTTTFGTVAISANGTWSNPINESISIGGNLSVGSGATFSQGTGLITFTGNSSNTVTNVASIAFGGGITVNKGASQANVIDFQGPITMLSGGLTLSNGTFKLSNASSTITPFSSDPAFGANAGLWCNGGTMLGNNTNVSFSGSLQVSAGTVTIGTSTENNLVPNSGSAGTVNVSGGVLNVAGRITGLGSAWNFIMSSGTCTLATVGTNANTNAYIFSMPFGSNFTMSGGTLILQAPVATTANGYFNQASTSTVTGGMLQIGNISTPASSIIGINSTVPIWNLTVVSANATAQVQAQAVTVSNNLTVSSGTLDSNGQGIAVGGNWTNNATFLPSTATVTLSGAAQAISGTANFYNLALTGSNTKTFSTSTTIGGNLSIASGVVANLSTITTHTARTLTLNGANQTAIGSWGGTGSGATNINATFFAATTGQINIAGRIFYSIATGNWNAPATWSNVGFGGAASALFPTANDDVNVGGGSYTVTVNVNSSCGTITYQSATNNSTAISINAGQSLTVSGAIIIGGPNGGGGRNNTLAVGAGTLSAGSLAFTGNLFAGAQQLTISTGTATIAGNVTQTGGFLGFGTVTFTGTGTLNVGGAFLNSLNGTFTAGTGTVNYNGASQAVGDFTYYNLTLSGSGTKSLATNFGVSTINNNFVLSGTASTTAAVALTIGGSVTLGAGTTFTAGAFTHNIAGNWTNNGATFNNTGSTINMNGAAAQAIGGSSSTTFSNLSFLGSNTVTVNMAITVSNNISIGTGVVCNLTTLRTHTARTLTLNGTNQTAIGSWGGTGSGATNINGTYFASTIGWLNVTGRIFYTRATGNWNASATWSNVGFSGAASAFFPGTNDDANIGGGNYTVTVNGSSSCSTITYQSATNNSPTVSINTGQTLTVSGAIIIGGPNGGRNNTLAVGAGTLSAGSLAFTGGAGAGAQQLTISTGTATITGDVTQTGFFGTGTITVSGAGTLNVAGAFLNSGNCNCTFTLGTVNYNSTSVAQTVGDFTYNNLTLNNTFATSPQFTLFGNATVSNILTMTAGVMNLGGNTLTLSLAATGAVVHSLAASSGWMYNGTVSRAFPTTAIAVVNADGLLPVGTATDFRPFFFSKTNTVGSSGTLSITHTDPGNTSTGLSIPDTAPVATIIIRNNAVWASTLTGGTGATFGIQYGGTGLGTVNSLNDVRSMLQNSVIGTNVTATQYSTSNPQVQRSALTAAQMTNNFYVGSTNASTTLPIQLISFTGTAESYGVDLQWNTQSELNNDYFTVLHSSTGSNFIPISKVPGSGTTNAPHTYTLTDYHPASGLNYYQLQQTDFDGKVSTFEVIAVTVTGDLNPVKIYPNPVAQNQDLNVELSGLTANVPALLQVMNMQGTSLVQAVVNTDETGSLKTAVASGGLVPGVYILTVGGVHYKFIVK